MTAIPQGVPLRDVPPDGTTGLGSIDLRPVFLPPAPRRVVFDTNVLVSLYIFSDSRFSPLRAKIESGAWLALGNDVCLEEFRRVLAYPMFQLSEVQQSSAFAAYGASVSRMADLPATTIASLPRCRDRDDQKFLELARDAAADWLVTSDKALLRLARRDRLRGLFYILTPEAALAEV